MPQPASLFSDARSSTHLRSRPSATSPSTLKRSDPARECGRVLGELERQGPIDLCVLGLGKNGHVGLIEPAPCLQPHCHVAKLADETLRHADAELLRRPGPHTDMTLGIADILAARKILLLITGAGKERSLAKFLEGTVTTEVPATFLWLHHDLEVFVDERQWLARDPSEGAMQTRIFLLTFFVLSAAVAAAAGVSVSEFDEYVLTHELTPFGPLPTAQDPNGVYPYVSYAETSRRPSPRKYRFVVLENPHLKVTVSPDLGGKVISMIHKPSGREVLYVPDVIRRRASCPASTSWPAASR